MSVLTVNKHGSWIPLHNEKKRAKERRYMVGYAPSSRARCRKCSEAIEKGCPRFGVPIRDPRGEHGYISAWQHFQCTRVEDEDLDFDLHVYGFDQLTDEHQALLRTEALNPTQPAHFYELDPDEIVKRGPLRAREPPPTLTQHLLPYQMEGFGWMCEQEEAAESADLSTARSAVRGGLLADEMGMGKTIQTVALLLERRGYGPTLVVCPLSSMLQWKEEIANYTEPGSLRVLVFHGSEKVLPSSEDILRADVVLTTYHTIEAQWRKLTAEKKIKCSYCGKAFLPRKMAVHLKYYCGPDAAKTLKQRKQEKKQSSQTVQKGLRSLKVVGENEAIVEASREVDGRSLASNYESDTLVQRFLTRRKNVVSHLTKNETTNSAKESVKSENIENIQKKMGTPMAIYRELMADAGRRAYSRFDRRDYIMKAENENSQKEGSELLKHSNSSPKTKVKGLKSAQGKPASLTAKEIIKNEGQNSLCEDTNSVAVKSEEEPLEIVECNDVETEACLRSSAKSKPSQKRLPEPTFRVSDCLKDSTDSDDDKPFLQRVKTNFRKDWEFKQAEDRDNAPLPEDEADIEGFEGVPLDFSRSVVHGIQWYRIVLDEAHKIKSKTTSTARGIFALRGSFKWCLTGTPLQNRVGELYSLIRFIRVPKFSRYYCQASDCKCTTLAYPFTWKQHRRCIQCGHGPLQHYGYFNKHVLNPIRRYGYIGDGRKGLLTLKEKVLDQVMLRRTKSERSADLNLDALQVSVSYVELRLEERDFYESLYKRSEAKFDTFVKKGTLLNNYAHIFDLLSSLRQALDHPYIVLYRAGSAELPEKGTATSNPALDICALCQDLVSPSHVTSTKPCLHTFHRNCLYEYISQAPQGDIGCPRCFSPLTLDLNSIRASKEEESNSSSSEDEEIRPIPPPQLPQENEPQGLPSLPKSGESKALLRGRRNILQRVDTSKFESSSKLEKITSLILRLPDQDKAIIFSQYANMLDLVEWRLQKEKVQTTKLLGSMPLVMRQSMLSKFRNPESSVKVMLISLKAGGEGLNLQVANHVFLIDPWWNPAVEMQAAQRVHRIGQCKKVYVTRFITRDTIEERMLELQQKKQLVFEGTIDAQRNSIAKLTEEDLRFLFSR